MQPHVGIIGAGLIGRFHSRGVHGLTKLGLVDATYVAICDRDLERAETFARIANLDFATADPDELIASPKVNTVYVCTPTAEHNELVLRAAAAGKHVFCEKPLARTLAGAQEMYDAVQSAGIRHQVGLILRHSPVFIVLKEMISDPALGRLMTIIFRDDQAFPVQGHYGSAWRGDVAIAGGGTLIEHSIHDLDLLTWLAGDVETVQAQTRNYAGHEDIEDLASVMLNFADGATAQLTSVWHDIKGRASGRHLELFFERGYFSVDQDFFGSIKYETNDTQGPATISDQEVRQRYFDIAGIDKDVFDQALGKYSLEDYFFLQALAEDRDPHPGFDIALRAHKLVDAAYCSAAEGGRAIDPN